MRAIEYPPPDGFTASTAGDSCAFEEPIDTSEAKINISDLAIRSVVCDVLSMDHEAESPT